ncbi:MAG: hypothetical protein Q8S03_03995 [Brevundimonas sp.]|uniref:hypothetical protein n=1 Tax=Brevundimonas sp. TaxID=1871086 RepID=UPI0027341D84|nr:hypothetical protein [Brevundimonas sp.]MDP3403829.1 hypothetical protein [Brevundimonas sp.]
MEARTERQSVALVRHRDGESSVLTGVTVHVERQSGILLLKFVARGDIHRLALPEPGEFQRAEELWRHTCFEAFVDGSRGEGYREFNLSSSNGWAAYAFSGYREGMRSVDGSPVRELNIERSASAIVVRTVLEIPYTDGDALILGLSVVEEDTRGRKSYWALAHMEDGPPDFHHPIAFDLSLFPVGPA